MGHDEWNESVANINFVSQAESGDKFLHFTLFKNSKNCTHFCNQMFNCDGIWI